MVVRNLQHGSLKEVHPERKAKQGTEGNTAHRDKTCVIKKGQEKPTVDRKVKPSIYNRQLFPPKENRTPKQCKPSNAVPLTTTPVQGSTATHTRAIIDSVDAAQQHSSLTGTNEVIPFSNEFSTVERDIEHLIAELDSKTKSSVKLQRRQGSSAEKVLQFKLSDQKLISSSGSKIVLSNNSGFIDSITVEIKLNKEQLMNEFANGEPQQLEEENNTCKAGKETPLSTNKHSAPDRLKQLILQRLNQKENETSVPSEKKSISHEMCKETNSYGAEFMKHKRIATQRWISDLLKGIGSVETLTELTENDQSEVSDEERKKVKSQSGQSHSLAPTCNLPLHGSTTKALSLMDKPKTWQSPKMTFRQSAENDHSLKTERPAKNVSCGHKGQQKKAERDVRIALWQEKNKCLGGTLKDKNMQDGLVGKVRDSKLISSSCYMKK